MHLRHPWEVLDMTKDSSPLGVGGRAAALPVAWCLPRRPCLVALWLEAERSSHLAGS